MTLPLLILAAGAATAHQGHNSDRQWQACEQATLGDVCSFDVDAHTRHVGTCRSMSDALICVRNPPIEDPTAHSSTWVHVGIGLSTLLALGVAAPLSIYAMRR